MKFRFNSGYPKVLTAILLAMTLLIWNCSNTARGGVLGGLLGGGLGGLIGKKSGNTAAGIIIGAAVGGTAGAAIGRYMDKQAEELEKDLEGARVERVGEGIKITFDSGILFGFDSDNLTDEARNNVGKMADILKKYEDTNVIVQGHTDSVGTEKYNMRLSEQRALSVAHELVDTGIDKQRLNVEAYGENMPVADNRSKAGREQNRRVEIAIFANDELKKAAMKNKDLNPS